MPLTEEIMHTQFYDKVDEYNSLDYTKNPYKQEVEETIHDIYKMFFDGDTVASEVKHMPYPCWIYNDDLQQECAGNNTCAADMLNALPTDKHDVLLIAHNSNYG